MQEHHAERQQERGLKSFDHQTRDQTIALHDREMKVPLPPPRLKFLLLVFITLKPTVE